MSMQPVPAVDASPRSEAPLGAGSVIDPLAGQYVGRYHQLQARLLERFGFDAQSRFVNLESIKTRVHLLDGGAGDPVLLLHGGAGVGAEHIPVAARLAARFRIIIPDRPGHGLSDAFSYRSTDLRRGGIDFISTLLDELQIERASLVGNSFGGYMAVSFAMAHPERVSRLVILSFFPGMLDRELPLMMRLMVVPGVGAVLGRSVGRPTLQNTRRFFGKLIVGHIDRMPDELLELETIHSQQHGRSILELFRAGISFAGFRKRYVVGDEISHIKVPTSVVWGERDRFKSVEDGRATAARVPGGKFLLIPDAGHMPSCDQPEITARLLEQALAG